MMRSILSVLAGMAAWSALWLGANGLMTATLPQHFREDGGTEHTGILLCILAVSVVCSLLAGFLTASLARARPGLHVLVLALIHLAIGTAVEVASWSLLPAWYHLSFLALLVPGHLVGGKLRGERRVAPAPA